jgi:hypothetical protein
MVGEMAVRRRRHGCGVMERGEFQSEAASRVGFRRPAARFRSQGRDN